MGSITLDHVAKRFGELAVIPDINLAIADGEFAVFVGPSGCGKSTLLRLIAGLEDTSSGKIVIDGADVTALAPAQRGLAMVFQSYALYPHMSVYGNIAFPLKMAGPGEGRDRPQGARRGGRAEPDAVSRSQAAPIVRAGSASAWRSAAPSCASRRRSCSTSRCPTSTPRCASTCDWRSANSIRR